MNAQIKFTANPADAKLLAAILVRAADMYTVHMGVQLDGLTSLAMDLRACHLNGCPLQLQELLDADDANFAHDVWGIQRHLDRNTGQLTGHFLPRFAE